jgi:CBS domain-containing protein
MKNITAKEIMTRDVVTVTADMPVKDLADLLASKDVSGTPVVDAAGTVVGLASESDLIVADARIHYPTYVHLLDGFIYWPSSAAKFNEEFKKALGSTVGDIMTDKPVTAREDATVEDLATLMTDNEVSRIPIVDAAGKIAGIVTKHDIVTAISKSS